ncbi:MAG: filamentous hemagglutinin N-terminal domain-containing protein [Cyanobacteria bacterium P01_F01_bin.116]
MSSVQAQVTPDGTLSTQVTSSDNQNFTIEAGDRAGNNLFHSFSEFSIPTNGSVLFDHDITIENIFSRVTGNNISDIDGLIQANGTANVFLINPNGILFGENASLNIGGSFIASTAEHILFSDTTEFSAVDVASLPLLTVSTPIGLGLGASPRPITVTGPGHNLELDFNTFAPIRTNRPVGLQVNTGETLALIGGDILIEGGNLTANQSRIELGSVDQASTVSLIPTTDGFTFGYDTLDRFSELSLTQAASIDVSGEGSGNLHLQAGNLFVLEGSAIISNVLGAEDGGKVKVQVSDSVEISGSQLDLFPSSFFNQGELNSTGQVGELFFEVGTLRIFDGAQINSSISGQGDGGSIDIQANTIELTGISPGNFFISGIFAHTNPGSEGNAGSIELQVDSLQASARARITAETFDQGNGGNIDIQAPQLLLQDSSFISVDTFGSGAGGTVNILNAGRVNLQDGSFISVDTRFGGGDGGTVNILNAGQVNLQDFSSISANTTFGGGDGGTVNILNAGQVNLQDFSFISSDTFFGGGDGGTIQINAQDLNLRTNAVIAAVTAVNSGNGGNIHIDVQGAISLTERAQITTESEEDSFGDSGDIDISTGSLILEKGSRLSTLSRGFSDAGDITIRARDAVTLREAFISPDNGSETPTSIFAQLGFGATGEGGDIFIAADSLSVRGGGEILTNTFGLGDAGNIQLQIRETAEFDGVRSEGVASGVFSNVGPGGIGDAGRIEIQAGDLNLTNGARIASSVEGLEAIAGLPAGIGEGGEIWIRAETVLLSGVNPINPNRGGIFTDTQQGASGDGGSITITTDTLRVANDAQINSQSENANQGGDINVTVGSQLQVDAGGAITASGSGSGSGGNLQIRAGFTRLDNGDITSRTSSNDGGNITLSSDSVLLLRNGSQISATAGTEMSGGNGGDIKVDTDFVIAIPEGNSDITANAFEGRGGNVVLNAQGVFGIEFRESLTPLNDITASSNFGQEGFVTINAPATDPSASTGELPTDFADVSALIGQSLCAGEGNEFTISGRGGLPVSPYAPFNGQATWEDWSIAESESSGAVGAVVDEFLPSDYTLDRATVTQVFSSEQSVALVEAQGWLKDSQGNVVLTAPGGTSGGMGLSDMTHCRQLREIVE